MNQYWLIFHQDTFLWLKNKECCIYNSGNYQYIHFKCKHELRKIIQAVLRPENLYRVAISEKQLQKTEIRNWIDKLLFINCADFINSNDFMEIPVSLKPILKLKDEVNYYKYQHEKNRDSSIMNNLHNLVIHVNESTFGNDTYAKQIIFPITRKSKLDVTLINKFINSYGNTLFLSSISLVGCIWKYQDYETLYNYLKTLGVQISIYCTEKDIIEENDTILKKVPNITLHILISDYNIEHKCLLNLYSAYKNDVFFDFVITNHMEYKKAQSLIEKYQLLQTSIQPIYTGKNLPFFENYIYTTLDDFNELELTKQNVFAHQELNTHFFGTLTVYPWGDIFSDTTQVAIGTINESIYEIVYREITEGNAWLRTRGQKPCCNCVYQYLCPSPTSYEIVIGQANLCHINNK